MADKITRFPDGTEPPAQRDFAAAVKEFGAPDISAPQNIYPWMEQPPAKPRTPLPDKNLPTFTGTFVGIEPWTSEPGLCAEASVATFESEGLRVGFIVKNGSFTEDMNIGDKYGFTYQPRLAIAFKEDGSHLDSAEFKMEYNSPEIYGHLYSFLKPPARKSDIESVRMARPIPLR